MSATEASADPARLLSIAQVSERLQIGEWLVYKLINERQLRTIRIGRRRLIVAEDLQSFIERQRREQELLP